MTHDKAKALDSAVKGAMMFLLISFCFPLVGHSQPEDVNSLIQKLKYKDRDAVEALVKIGKPALDPLIAALKDENKNVRLYAAWALGKIGYPHAIEALMTALKDEDKNVRSDAVRALREICELTIEIATLKDKDPSARSRTVKAVKEAKDPRAVGLLLDALKDKNSSVRTSAVEALAKIGKSAVDPLIDALKDENSSLRWYAAKVLYEIGDTRAVEPLITALKDQNAGVRGYAGMALRQMTGKDFGRDHEKWRKWWEQNKEEFSKNK